MSFYVNIDSPFVVIIVLKVPLGGGSEKIIPYRSSPENNGCLMYNVRGEPLYDSL